MKLMNAMKPLVLVAALASAGVVSAATYELNTLSQGDNYLSGFETSNISVSTAGYFSDIFHFTLSGNSTFDGVAGVLNFGKFKIADASFTYALYAGTLTGVTGSSLAGGANDLGFNIPVLAGGDYSLFVSGIATGIKGGQYNGALTVAAVPEPESYAMFVAGLGIMGAVVRRRSSKLA